MYETVIELDMATRRCADAIDAWNLDAEEREGVIRCGIGIDEPGAAVALETRLRHIVDVDRAVERLVGCASLLPLWLRLPQDAFGGLSPLDLMLSHTAGLRQVRQLLVRECLERGFD